MIMLANDMMDPKPVQSTNSSDTAVRRFRILVVDDNHDSALSLAMVLTHHGSRDPHRARRRNGTRHGGGVPP